MGHPITIPVTGIVLLIMIGLGLPVTLIPLTLADYIPTCLLTTVLVISSLIGMGLNLWMLYSVVNWLRKKLKL